MGGWHTQAIKAALKARGVIENDIVRGPTQQRGEVSKKELLLWLESKGLAKKESVSDNIATAQDQFLFSMTTCLLPLPV